MTGYPEHWETYGRKSFMVLLDQLSTLDGILAVVFPEVQYFDHGQEFKIHLFRSPLNWYLSGSLS
jgi:hypothetical protein